jgi:hypothetical protein
LRKVALRHKAGSGQALAYLFRGSLDATLALGCSR